MKTCNRRDFIKALGLTAAGATLPHAGLTDTLCAAETGGGSSRRPNFLFIYTDDQRWDGMSVVQKEQGDAARFPWIRTPNMDRLAAEGLRFRNAFVVNSLCAPSRACFLTGQYSHLNGVANNHTAFPLDNVTHATLLRQAGYATGYFGKFHMGQQKERPGFDVFASFVGQGKYFDCPFMVNGKEMPTKGWVDDVTTAYALEFLNQHKEKPFSMVVGFKSPHGPRSAPDRFKDLYAGENANPPKNFDAQPPFHAAEGAKKKKARAGAAVATTWPANAERQEDIRNEYRTLAGVDENIGKLLKALDDAGLAENTVVIFCSDNGYYFGEHGLGDKRSAYDESLRIPMLVRFPKMIAKGRVADEMVLNIDLAPTLLDLAGVAVPATMQGRSWRPLLEGKSGEWRKAFFYEYFMERNFQTPTVLAVRTDDAKLIKYPGHDDWTELFDLRNDPLEMKNLARDEAGKDLLKRMEAEFDRQAKDVQFKIPDYADKSQQAPDGKS